MVWKPEWFPMRVIDITKFEKANPGYAINVLTYTDSKTKFPKTEFFKNPNFCIIRKSKADGQKIFLLLLENETSFHYTAVVNLDRLLNTQIGSVYKFDQDGVTNVYEDFAALHIKNIWDCVTDVMNHQEIFDE